MSTAAPLLLLLERWIYGSITLFAIDSLTKVKIEQANEMKNRNHHHHHHRLHHRHCRCRCRCRCRNRNYDHKWSRRTRGWRRWFFFSVFSTIHIGDGFFCICAQFFFHPLWNSSLNVQFMVCKTKIKTKPKRSVESKHKSLILHM